ncbi:MAG TPA: tetratricopeptide repeat protein, partial [Anaerolineales bacterium]|nr:tetratricopeptide repeat protein [Anaerolineales bacterium]
AQRQLMRLLALSGHRNEALEQYRTFEASLQTELGVHPEAETAALYGQIQSGNLKPGGDRGIPSGTVTFLFCDIETSTRLLRELGKDYTELLSAYREQLEAVLVRWDGTEIDRQGDALFCSFPRATDAVNAAVDAQRRLAGVEWPHGIKVSVRMGIHAGEPWVIEEGYVGLDVHRAARIGAMGSGGQVLLSLAVSELVKDSLPAGVSLINLGYYLLKDFDRPESISQLSISGLRSEFPALKGEQSSPPQVWQQEAAPALPGFLAEGAEPEAADPAPRVSFVARETELEKLQGLLQQVLEGQGTAAFVTGGPGRGKTALMAEFTRREMLEHPDLLVISGSCSAYTGIGDPYLPFRDALGMLSGDVEERWRTGSISREHAIRLWQALPLVLDAVLDSGLNLLNSLIPGSTLRRNAARMPSEHNALRLRLEEWNQNPGMDELEQSHLFQQVVNVLAKVGDAYPIVLLLDDLQWSDDASISLLFHLGRRLKGIRILVVGAYRPVDIAIGRGSERHPLEMVLAEFKRDFGDVWIDLELPAEEIGKRFVELLLDTEPNHLEESFRDALFAHTGGHPLFTIETLRTLQARGALVKGRDGPWEASAGLSWGSIPSRVEGVIEERISRLDDDLRDLLNIASVEGENFTLEVIAQIKNIPERGLLPLLVRELEKKHSLIVETGVRQVRDRRHHTFKFQHSLYQQYLYNKLGKIEREFLHADVAEALESLEEEMPGNAPQLAYHFNQAGNRDKSATYLVQAARIAHQRFAHQEAIEDYTQALKLIPEGDRERRFQVILEREAAFALIGNRDDRRRDLLDLDALAKLSGDPEQRAEAALRMAKFAGTTGDFPEAIQNARQVVPLAQEHGFLRLAASALIEWGRALAFRGDLDEARARLTQALEMRPPSEPEGKADPVWQRIEAGILNNLAYISNIQGYHAGSRAYLERTLGTYRQLNDRHGESVTLQNLGVVSYDMGDLMHAGDCWEQALTIFREVGDRRHEAMVMNSLGNISSDLFGDYAEAQKRHEAALAIAVEVGDRSNEGMAIGNLGLAAIGQADYSSAKEYTGQALAIYRDLGLKPAFGEIYFILGESLAGLEDREGAIQAYEQAIRYGDEFDQEDVLLKARAGLARAALILGNLDQARSWAETLFARLEDDLIANELKSETKFQVYLTCYQVYQAVGEARTSEVIGKVYSMLQEHASRLEDPAIRRQFLENVRWHKEIVEAYLT